MTPELFSHTTIKDVEHDLTGFNGKTATAYWLEDGKVKFTFNE